jgi:hypothetical protein
MTTSLASLIVQETKAALYDAALAIAVTVGLPVTTWEEGDPTRSLYEVLSSELEKLEGVAARYVASGFLDLAARLDDSRWLKLTAYQKYGYTAREATYSTCTVRLTNAGAGVYVVDAQDLSFALTANPDVTYRNTSGGTLLASSTLDITVECEVAGSDGSAGIGDLELVTTIAAGIVSGTNTTAAVGTDEETPASIVAGCRAKLEALSPNGAAGAYEYVALNSEITGAADVTRVKVVADSDTGDVAVYLASSGGAASGPDVALVEAAIVQKATPQCVTPTVSSAAAYPITITPTVYLYDSVGATEAEIKTAVVAAVNALFASIPIGGDGDDGKVFRARIIGAIIAAYPGYVFQVDLSLPATDVTLTAAQVATATIDTASVTVELESAP